MQVHCIILPPPYAGGQYFAVYLQNLDPPDSFCAGVTRKINPLSKRTPRFEVAAPLWRGQYYAVYLQNLDPPDSCVGVYILRQCTCRILTPVSNI